MAETTVTLNADAAGFERALSSIADDTADLGRSLRRLDGDQLDDVAEGASDAARELDKADKKAGGLFQALQGGAIIVTGINQAFSLLGKGVTAARDSFERYLRQTEDGDKMWEQLERRLFALRGMFAELLLGTDDTEEGFEALIEAADLTVGVFRELVEMVSFQQGAFVQFVRGGLALLVDGIGTAIQVYGAFQQAINFVAIGFDLFVTAVGVARDALVGLVSYIAGNVLQAFGSVLGAIENLAEGASSFGGRLNPLRNQLGGVADEVGAFRDEITGLADGLQADGGQAFDSIGDRIEGFNERTERGAQEIHALNDSTNEAVGRFRGLADSIRDGTFEFEALNLELGGSGGTVENLDRIGDALERVRDLVQDRIDAAIAEKEASQELAFALEKELQARFDLEEATRKPVEDQSALKRAEMEQAQLERLEATIGPVQDAFGSFFSKIEDGQMGLMEAIRETVAEQLWAKGMEALLSAPLLLFSRGPQAVAYQAGAGAAAMAGAAIIRSGSGGGGGSAAGAGLAAPATGGSSVQNFTTNNQSAINIHGNVVGDDRSLARLGHDIGRAQRRHGAP